MSDARNPIHPTQTNPPDSAAIVPPSISSTATSTPVIDPTITTKLKNTREQREVVGPLVQYLVSLNWKLEQMEFGKREWRVPKSPSEATKRERGNSFDGFPVCVAIFDSPERRGDMRHLLIIIETKTPDEPAGVDQLETYLSREPYVKVGVWVNVADPS